MTAISKAEIDRLVAGIKAMSHADMAYTLALLEELEQRKRVNLCQMDFLAFIAAVDPHYKFGAHLKRLGSLLMQVESGVKDRVAVSMAPRFGKSTMISIYYPAWYLGKHPEHKLIVASHTSDLAVDMARKVRNLMQSDVYKSIFPNVSIAADAKAAGKWNTTKGGEVYAVGVGGSIAGRGADLLIVDDPLSEQDIKSGNTDSLDAVYEYFRAGLRTRLMPGGRICILHCLVGDTPVTLADGSEKLIRDVRPGDMVASYDGGRLRAAKVLGWSNQGLDQVYSLALRSGVIIRGNERHPFLVDFDGERKWVKIKDLKVGMRLVSTRDAHAHLTVRANEARAKSATTESGGTKKPQGGFLHRLRSRCSSALRTGVRSLLSRLPDLGYAYGVKAVRGTTKSTLTRQLNRLGIMGGGEGLLAQRPIAIAPLYRWAYVGLAAIKLGMPNERLSAPTTTPKNVATRTSRCATASAGMTTTGCSVHRVGNALYAGSLLTMETPPLSGKFAGWRSTIATTLGALGRFFATSAICSSKSATPSRDYSKLLSTFSITLDEIVSIAPDGVEDVFDIQVEGTENFLAHGVVSHNTRWHQRDLIGRLIKDGALNPDGDVYEVFEFPAILTVSNPRFDENDPESEPRTIEKSLWPEQWSLESLLRTKASMPSWQWNAQYQQAPTAQEAAIIKRDDIQWWPHERPPQIEFTVQAFDTAMTTKERSDYSVCQTWGVWKDDNDVDNVILLNCVRGKWEFPELKRVAHEQAKEWEPDALIIETKASGQPLTDELRRSGIIVQEYSPGKGQDKIARVNAISDMFASRQVWFPETWWASEVVEELLAFPAGEHDDCVDALTLALIRIRKGGLLRLANDVTDEPRLTLPRRTVYY